MKKRLLAALILLFTASFMYSAVINSEQPENNSKLVVTGYIVSKGNMPFTFPAVKTETGEEIMFTCTSKQKKKLFALQGQLIRFTFEREENNVLVLKKWKTIDAK